MSATVERPASSPTDAISYEDLYARWERGNWRAMEIDLSQDRIDWHEKLTPEQRRGALWMYSLFFHGEDSVADNLSPYIDAAPLEEQKYFLATQQVDEARHAVFFKRFMHEVVGAGTGSIGSSLGATFGELTWGHRKVFTRLDEMADELRADRSKAQLAKAVTLYHVVIEASLAQPGQHMIGDYLEELDILPGFRAGMRNVELDEQRHIAFGVKLLADFYREDPEMTSDAILEVIRETLTWTAATAKPPGWDETYITCFGKTLSDLGELGAASQEQKLRSIGLPVDTMPGLPLRMDLPPRERAERGMKLLRCNFLGPDRPVVRDPEVIQILFESIALQADPRHAPPGTTVQWDFTDSDPWYVALENGSTRAVQGRSPSADLTLKCTLDDWADVVADRADVRKLFLRGRLRPRGKLRLLPKLPQVFGV